MDAFVSFLQTPWAIVIALAIAVVIGMVIRLVVSSRRSSNEVTSRPREQVPASGDVAAPAEAEESATGSVPAQGMTGSRMARASSKKTRRSVPSWDEILFGSKS